MLRMHQLAGLGLSESEELAKIQAQKASVAAEIARLKGGGAPVPGGFQPAAAVARASVSRMPPSAPIWPKVLGGVAVLGLVAYGVSRMTKKRRKR